MKSHTHDTVGDDGIVLRCLAILNQTAFYGLIHIGYIFGAHSLPDVSFSFICLYIIAMRYSNI